MSDTPRTNAHVERLRTEWEAAEIGLPFPESDFDLCKGFEREVTRLTRRLKEARETIARYEDQWIDEHI